MARIKRAVFKFTPFSRQQKKILTWWLPESGMSHMEGIIADGAIRSGKTVPMALSFVMWALTSFDEENFAMCGKTIGSFRRNVLDDLKNIKPLIYDKVYSRFTNDLDDIQELIFVLSEYGGTKLSTFLNELK